jgi:hypothetical protein
MRKIIFDIETCCFPFESLSESQQEYLLRYAEKEQNEEIRTQKKEDAIRYLSLYPLTAKVIALGIFDVEKEKTFVYYENNSEEEWSLENKNVHFQRIERGRYFKIFLEDYRCYRPGDYFQREEF